MKEKQEEGAEGEEMEMHRSPCGRVENPLTFAVIGEAQKVHRALGPGFTESTYKRAMAVELVAMKIPFEVEREFEVFYQGVPCGTYRADMIADSTLVIEYKAVQDFSRSDFAQTISYLRASGLPIGLLINFGAPSLQVRRFKNPRPPSRDPSPSPSQSPSRPPSSGQSPNPIIPKSPSLLPDNDQRP
jgi:GxxExxY protein